MFVGAAGFHDPKPSPEPVRPARRSPGAALTLVSRVIVRDDSLDAAGLAAAQRRSPPMDRNAVESMSLANLAKLYNELAPGKPVKKFADRKAAVRRVLAALEERAAAEPAKAPARESRPSRRERAAEHKQHTPTGELRPPRPGSKRGRLLAALMADGMTAERIASEFGWKPRDVADALRLLAAANGYVVYREEGGDTWRAAEPERDPAPVRAAAQPGPKRRRAK